MTETAPNLSSHPWKIESPWQALAKTSVFWPGVMIMAGLSFWNARDCGALDLLGFLFISIAALIPSYMWCSGRTFGIPIFPLYAVCTIWAFAMPLISGHPIVNLYPEIDRFRAALTVTATTLAGTVAWYMFANRIPRPRARCYALPEKGSDLLFFFALILGIFFNVALLSIDLEIPPALFSLIKQVLIALDNITVFVLSYRYGTSQLGVNQRWLFGLLFSLLVISSLPYLYLITTASYAVLALSGYVLGRGIIPWTPIFVLVVALAFLHQGKSAMRDKYWGEDRPATITPTDYPAFIAEWFDRSMDNFTSKKGSPYEGPLVEDHESFVNRSSLMHLLLLEQSLTPMPQPYLNGLTYASIPELLVPRFLNANKTTSNISTNLLAAYYGLIDPTQPINTTIGFGMLNEAYANFGYSGCLGFGIILGSFYGLIANFSAAYPLLSLRSLLSVIVLALSFESEFTASVYVTAIFQSAVVLSSISLLFMKKVPVQGYRPKFANSSPFA